MATGTEAKMKPLPMLELVQDILKAVKKDHSGSEEVALSEVNGKKAHFNIEADQLDQILELLEESIDQLEEQFVLDSSRRALMQLSKEEPW
jgi:hypothetical protein